MRPLASLPAKLDPLHPRVWGSSRLGANLVFSILGGAMAMCVVTFIAGIASFSSHLMTDSTRSELQAAYSAVRADLVAHNRSSFSSVAATAHAIELQSPKLLVKQGYDYNWLRGHHVQDGALYVKSVTPTTLDLVARQDGDAIVELKDTLGSGPEFHNLYVGKGHLGRFLLLLEIGGGLTLLGMLGWSLADDGAHRRKRLKQRRLGRTAPERWRELVFDARFGPGEPRQDFALWKPIKEDEDGACLMRVVPVIWNEQRWVRDDYGYAIGRKPKGLETVRVPAEQGLAKATEEWVSFCHRTSQANADRWKRQLEQEDQDRREALEREVREQEAKRAKELEEMSLKALAQAQTIAEHLPDHREIMRGLPIE